MTGVIGLSLDAGVEAERVRGRLLKKRVFSHSRSMICGSCSRTSSARDARGGDGRRMRRREQKRPRAMVEKLDERAAPGDVAAEHADRLRQRADLNVDAAVHAEMIDGAAAVPAEHAARVRIVDHHDAAELLGQRAQLRQRPRSPSMLNTPSVMSSLRWPAGSAASTLRAASTSLCGKTLIVARLNRQPSMMLA